MVGTYRSCPEAQLSSKNRLRLQGHRPCMKVIKTWSNGWATSRRLHETNTFPCLFGCLDSEDDLRHYTHCKILLAFSSFLRRRRPLSSLHNFGLIGACRDQFCHVCCTFSGYHAMHRKAQFTMHDTTDFCMSSSTRRLLWSVFAEAYHAEARELGLSARKYSLIEFFSFLIDFED